MKLLTCPINGPRPLQEFVFGGEVRPMPNPETTTDKEWADYVFNREGEPGISKEWWYHAPSGTWFIAERDNMKDIILKTYLYGDASAAAQGVAGGGTSVNEATLDSQSPGDGAGTSAAEQV